MKSLVIIAVFFVAYSSSKPSRRIVGGHFAYENQFPHEVALVYYNQLLCGGSIISSDWVISAGHCMMKDQKNYQVLAGMINLKDENAQRRDIIKQIRHEDYISDPKKDIWANDILLVQLELPLILMKSVQPIKLATEKLLKINSEVIVIGYGLTETGYSSDDLKYTFERVESNNKCLDIVHDGLICLETKFQDGACNGDSGGSAIQYGKLVGIVSFGLMCGVGFPEGFTKVSHYVDWIKEKTNLTDIVKK